MDLLLNEEQSLIQQSVRAFARELGGQHLRRLPELPGRFPAREFEEAAAAGWLGLLLAGMIARSREPRREDGRRPSAARDEPAPGLRGARLTGTARARSVAR